MSEDRLYRISLCGHSNTTIPVIVCNQEKNPSDTVYDLVVHSVIGSLGFQKRNDHSHSNNHRTNMLIIKRRRQYMSVYLLILS